MSSSSPARTIVLSLAVLALSMVLYLWRINTILLRTPDAARRLASPPWTPALLRETYARLERDPPALLGPDALPPRLERRYIVTGGSGKLFSLFSFSFPPLFLSLYGALVLLVRHEDGSNSIAESVEHRYSLLCSGSFPS